MVGHSVGQNMAKHCAKHREAQWERQIIAKHSVRQSITKHSVKQKHGEEPK